MKKFLFLFFLFVFSCSTTAVAGEAWAQTCQSGFPQQTHQCLLKQIKENPMVKWDSLKNQMRGKVPGLTELYLAKAVFGADSAEAATIRLQIENAIPFGDWHSLSENCDEQGCEITTW